ncbi:hypothetical protein MRX96_003569 [Rhipicephalus microplus]
MDAEPQTSVNLPVVLISRRGLYVIIAVLTVSILGCGGVLTYSFTNYAKLNRNAEDVRNYIASRAKTADRHRGDNQMAVGDIRVSSVDNRSVGVKTVIPLAAATGRQVANARIPTSNEIHESGGVNDTFAIVARQEIFVTEVAGPHFRFMNTGQKDGIGNDMAPRNATGSSGDVIRQ